MMRRLRRFKDRAVALITVIPPITSILGKGMPEALQKHHAVFFADILNVFQLINRCR